MSEHAFFEKFAIHVQNRVQMLKQNAQISFKIEYANKDIQQKWILAKKTIT